MHSFGFLKFIILFFFVILQRFGVSQEQQSPPFDCESFGKAEEALKVYLEAEKKGFRLEAGTRERMAYCFLMDDNTAWDLVRIVNNITFDKCKEKKKGPSCYTLRYGILGEVYSSQEFKKMTDPRYEEVEISIKLNNKKWELSGWKDIPPIVTKEGMQRYIETKRKTHTNKAWLEKLEKHLESLR